jgi:UDP-glucose 4-epimerase
MKILVTGGAGFIGSHIVDAYLRLGHQVVIVDNLITGRARNINPAATFYEADIRDATTMREIFDREKPDVLNHHAAQMDVRKSVEDPMYDASVNVIGALTLFENCVRTGVKRVLFASSGGAIYGEQEYFPADELHPTRPISPYGITKLVTEQYLYYYKTVYGMDSVSLRYANIYGPRQNPHGEAGVVAIFTTKLLAGDQPIINGEGKQTRDYVFVDDVVHANVLALNSTGSNIFNIGTGIETDVNQLFHQLKKSAKASAEEKHGEAKKGEQMRSVLSSAHVERRLGWKPSVTLAEGLQRTVDYFRIQEGYGA